MGYKSIISIKKLKKSTTVKTIGIIKNIESFKTKKGDSYISFTMKDNSGEINCILFNTNEINFKINDNVIIEGKFTYYYENINISSINLYKKIEEEEEKQQQLSATDFLYIKNTFVSIKDEFFKQYILTIMNDVLDNEKNTLKEFNFIKNSFEYINNIKNQTIYKNVNFDLLIIAIILNRNKSSFDIYIKNKKIEKINNVIYINDFNIFEDNFLFISQTLNNLNIFLNYFLIVLEENNQTLKSKIKENIEKLQNECEKLNPKDDERQIDYFNNEINNMYIDIKKLDEDKEKTIVKKQMYIHKIIKMCMLLQSKSDLNLKDNNITFVEYEIMKSIKLLLLN